MSRSSLTARRTVFAASLIAAVLAAPHAARAADVVTQLTGKIQSVHGQTPDATTQLAAHGVVVGADVNVSFTIDSTTPKDPPTGDPPLPYAYYTQAIKDLTISVAGGYEVTLLLPTGFEALDFVQVGNNVDVGPASADSYLLTTPATDTDLVLAGSGLFSYDNILLAFVDGDGSTISDDGVVQDAHAFFAASGAVAGALGSIAFTMDVAGPGGGGGGGGNHGPGLCRKGQLKAAGKFGSALLKAMGKHSSSQPDADPFGAKEAAAIDAAETQYAADFVKAVNKALGKGGSAPLPASEAGSTADQLQDGAGTLAEDLRAGADPENAADRALRGALFKDAAAMFKKDCAAYAANALKPSSTKLADKLASASAALEKQVDKAVATATKKGVDYTGPSGSVIADALEELADQYNQLTLGAEPAAAAAGAAAHRHADVALQHHF